MITINHSVGRGGHARHGSDVLKVQKLLNLAGAEPELVPDSSVGTNTIRAIERFQSGFMKRPDGRIDPGGKSIRRLNVKAAATIFFAAEFPLDNQDIAFFHKFDDPTRGYRGDTKGLRLRGGRQFVLRGGNTDTFIGPLSKWVQRGHRGRVEEINIMVRQFGGRLNERRVVFFGATPVSINLGMKTITIAFSYFRIRFD